jgi:hypothetical protein
VSNLDGELGDRWDAYLLVPKVHSGGSTTLS